MFAPKSCLWICSCLSLVAALQASPASYAGYVSNSIAAPGEPMYYLLADAGTQVAPHEERRRTNRSLMKWWDDLFSQNNCCNNGNNLLLNNNHDKGKKGGPTTLVNNCNGQLPLFPALPDLWGNVNNCAGGCTQSPNPNPAYDGPGNGDAGYVAPAAPAAQDSYAPPAAPSYPETPAAPPAAAYEQPASYEPAAPAPAPAPAPQAESYTKTQPQEYAQPAKSYAGGQAPQIVYQPIIYLAAGAAERSCLRKPEPEPEPEQLEPATPATPAAPAPCNAPACAGYLPLVGMPFYSYPAPPAMYAPQAPVYAPAPPPAPVYAPAPAPQHIYNAPPAAAYAAPAPPPVYAAPAPQPAYQPAAPAYQPPAPARAASPCCDPVHLSLMDQPYRVAPELFKEYHYRLALADRNRF
ncbi:skin secretory protein xP2 [Drosophila busckii]|uniref:skin secretory protein xP2 n=1 Tax=Drosophila busckii TaxID=30019 RepID=UPI001432FEA7|nr:skin secretory protein xP2 [Drosophila busckii]